MALDIRHSTFGALLELARPANVVTAWADIWAGVAAAGGVLAIADGIGAGVFLETPLPSLVWLLLATSGLYAGGVVLNDVYDAKLDATERPERAIPSGRITRQNALLFGTLLLILGVLAAFQVNDTSGWIAFAIGVCAIFYDRIGKHNTVLGPLSMGLCRAGNLMLGVSIVPAMLLPRWYLALIPLVYIGAITAVSRGEVHGGSKATGSIAVGLVFALLVSLMILFAHTFTVLMIAIGFILLFGWLVLPSFLKAAREPAADNIRRAVQAGIMGLIPLNAALAAGFAGLIPGLIVLSLLPISIGLARLFAVT